MALSFNIQRVGQWDEAERLLSVRSQVRFQRALRKAVRQEAEFARKKILIGMRRQAPAGKRFKPLERSTIAKRRFLGFRGRKALIVRGDLRNSIVAKHKSTGSFVGILRTATSKDGKRIVNIAEVQEFGRVIVIPTSPKMLAFLGKMFREGSTKRRRSSSARGSAGPTGLILVKIPARPFLRPVFKRFFGPAKRQVRMLARLSVILRGDYGFTSAAIGS